MSFEPPNYFHALQNGEDVLESYQNYGMEKPMYKAPCCGKYKHPATLNDLRGLVGFDTFQVEGSPAPAFVCPDCRIKWFHIGVELPNQIAGPAPNLFEFKARLMNWSGAPADAVDNMRARGTVFEQRRQDEINRQQNPPADPVQQKLNELEDRLSNLESNP